METKIVINEERDIHPCYLDREYEIYQEKDYFVVVRKLTKNEWKFSTYDNAWWAINNAYKDHKEISKGDLD